ncbi:MAG: GAF domain-containing protein [Planctomycetes bacterium]|nr:GAF domain-containing protein [Planctomycetota bacterium]
MDGAFTRRGGSAAPADGACRAPDATNETRGRVLDNALDIGTLLLGTLDLHETLRTVLSMLLAVAQARSGWIFLWRGDDRSTPGEPVAIGLSAEAAARLSALRPDAGEWGRALADRRAFALADTRAAADWPAELRAVAEAAGLRALATVPIRGPQGLPLGALCVGFESPCAPPRSHLSILETNAEFASVAIDRALQVEEIERQRAEFATVLADVPSAVVSVDREGAIVVFNRAAEVFTGLSSAAVAGRAGLALLTRRHPDLFAPLLACLERGEITNGAERVLLRPDAHPLYFSISARPLRDARTGAGLGAVQMFHDVSTFKALDRLKSDFVANVSHELRTPLTAIKGAVGVILSRTEGPLAPGQERFLNIVDRNTNRLVRLISDILDLAKMESGRLDFHPRPVSLVDVCADVVGSLKSLAEQRHIALALAPPASPPPLIQCDEDRIKQAITNLVSNGLKFTPAEGRVDLAVVDHGGEVRVLVSDTGIGIAPEDIGRLFDKFVQLDSGATAMADGTGLGLAITKEIVTAHRGRLWVESESGKGSTFCLALPKFATP